jgi:UDP-glucose 6-dehydrogenase
MIHFLGNSFAANHLREAARKRGCKLTEQIKEASLVFVSEDTPTDPDGRRHLDLIRKLVGHAVRHTRGVPIVLTSQVPVGFTRSLEILDIYHQAETLRIKDAEQRALNPEQIIVGTTGLPHAVPKEYLDYLARFQCPIFWMKWEEAEFSKIAINITLVSQVENTNRLAEYAKKYELRWDVVKQALENDRRIGPYSYLEPGRWQDSKHLLRDWVTFESR